jgi:predicted deacetylase
MGNKMRMRLMFSLLIVLAFATIITGSVYKEDLSKYNLFHQTEDQYYSLIGTLRSIEAQNSDLSYCYPSKPKEPTIIIRMDDIGAWNRFDSSKILIDTLLDRDIDVVLGVIPYNLEKDERVVSWLMKLRDDNRVEIALHGYNHEQNEFKDLYTSQASSKINEGKSILAKIIGTNPTTFIPPYNEYSIHLRKALKDNKISFFSAKENEYEIDGSIISLGYTARTYEFDEERFIPNSEVISDCKSSLYDKNLCIILMHPQDYTIQGQDTIDEQLFTEYIELLDELEKLNAEFKTFEDYLVCPSS